MHIYARRIGAQPPTPRADQPGPPAAGATADAASAVVAVGAEVAAAVEPTPAVGGDPMGCRRDAQGRCLEAKLCAASCPDFDPDDDCLAPVGERAWSSPIWLRPALDPGV